MSFYLWSLRFWMTQKTDLFWSLESLFDINVATGITTVLLKTLSITGLADGDYQIDTEMGISLLISWKVIIKELRR